MGIFAILMVIIMSILVINLKVSMRVKARSYAREESSFALNLLKKDIRNAESLSFAGSPAGAVPTSSVPLVVSVLDAGGTGHIYNWFLNGTQITRLDTGTGNITYLTPDDVTFDVSQGFWIKVNKEGDNAIVNVKLKVTTGGMPKDQWIYKEVAVSTRNINF